MVPSKIPHPFRGLGDFDQWVLWKLIPDPLGGKDKKVPINSTSGFPCNPHDPASQLDYPSAASAANRLGAGVGFVFTAADPFFFVDVDGAFVNGEWSELARQIYAMFPGAMFEISQSGTGFHIFGRYSELVPHSNKRSDLGLELYTQERFCATTFNGAAGGDTVQDAGYKAYASFFPPRETHERVEMVDEAVAGYSGPEDDETLISKMLGARNSMFAMRGDVASFTQLWEGDTEALAKHYPLVNENSADDFDHSSADMALASKLAFWTGKNPVRVERLLRRSGLMRAKWDDRPAWLDETISKAIGFCESTYGDTRPDATPDATPDGPAQTLGLQFLTPEQQREYFRGCVYISDRHQVLTADGLFLNPAQFKSMYGGRIFAMDSDNADSTKNAYEAFTESRALRWEKVNTTVFRPEDPPGKIYTEGGLRMANSYYPVEVPSMPGDVTPFLNLLSKMIPDDRDRSILLAYMAALLQNLGVKFQWCPVIQGVQGNGKTFLLRVMCMAIGKRYYHLPKAKNMDGDFNAWLSETLFIGVEEIRMAGKPDMEDALKDMITGTEIEIHAKNVNQVTGDNRANFMMCSNYKDAVIKSATDRRYCTFFTAQQSVSDLTRDGMDGEYWPEMWDWLRNENGSAFINHYLQNYEIPDELNPATKMHRAPETTSTREAMLLSVPLAQQILNEMIEEGAAGTRGGWLSMTYVNLAFERVRGVDRKQIREAIEALDYEPHPGLRNGRASSPIVSEDSKKPRLFVKRDSIQTSLEGAAVQAGYLKAQEIKPETAGVNKNTPGRIVG